MQDRGPLEGMSIGDLARSEVYTVDPETTIATVVQEFRDLNVGCAVVIEDGRPIGLLTDREIALYLAEIPDVGKRTARQLIGGDPITANEGSDVFDVLDTMSREGVRRIPIVDASGRLAGIVSLDDMLVLLADKQNLIAETVRMQFPDL